MGTIIHLPEFGHYFIVTSTSEADFSCLYHSFCCYVDGQFGRYNQRSITWSKHVNLPESMCARLLCLPAYSCCFAHRLVESNMVRKVVVRSDLARTRVCVGDEGVVNICRAVREKRETAASIVSCFLLLLDSRLVDSALLRVLYSRGCSISRIMHNK